ncbi:RNA polymerase sigma-70 factor, ECF subfamily protein [Kordia algicida OT-1]|uniref:RNA polymerase sigma-70 factor, ECF subfamily protein n=1 Tax=Kordia algicida OT-1 TaxID=391587 RepID=A9DQ36_9FLAO|nr:RNA polymerase sigma-70 factor, ECF subfamily protein [Kordia algicida OT-1]
MFGVPVEKNKKSLSDEELVALIVETQDASLFGELYDRYGKKIYNKCYSFVKDTDEIQDVTQDIFLKLFEQLHKYQGRAKFSTWLYSFTYNFLVNYKKRESEKKLGERWEKLNKNEKHLLQIEDVAEEDFFELKLSGLEKALDRIEPADKALLLLKYQDDVSVKDIQNLLQINESAVKMRLKRARIKLVNVYQKLQEND